MINSEKFNRVTNQVQSRRVLGMLFGSGLALALSLIISTCGTEAQFLAQNAPSALNPA